MNITKKLRNHLINYLKVTGVHVAILSGLAAAHILMSLVSNSDPFEKFQIAATIIYVLITAWFCWRLYTGMYRDWDFWD
jgi:ABC-type nickel/cobalt efflux system permease component RcnA